LARKGQYKTRSGRSNRSVYTGKSQRKKSKNTTQIVIISVLALALVTTAVLFLVRGGGSGSTGGATGQEVTTASGLKYIDEAVGSGPSASPGQSVTVNYVGTLENGKKFDSSYDRNQPYTLKLGQGTVIKGWEEGIPGMKAGGKRRLIVPADLAYGPQGRPGIPPNSTLIFEIELLSIQ